MFSLARTTVKLAHVNIRPEMRGPDEVRALDLKIESTHPQSVLDEIAPDLLDSFFFDGDRRFPDSVGDDELNVDADADAPHLRDLRIAWPVAMEFDGVGYTLRIQRGIGAPIEFGGVKINRLRVEPLEGGSVNLTMRVQISPVEDVQIGMVSGMLRRQIEIELIPPSAADLAQMAIDAGDGVGEAE